MAQLTSPPASPNPKTVWSPSKSAHTPSTSKSNKRKRFPGWVCEDELSEEGPLLLEKLEAQGREFTALPKALKIKYHVRPKAAAAVVVKPSPDAAGTKTMKPKGSAASKSNNVAPFKPKLTSPKSNQAPTKRKVAPPKRNQPSKTRKRAFSITPNKSGRPATKAPNAVRNKDTQPPKKKPRFRGYICEDEVEEEDPALADVIRQKGTLFELREAAAIATKSSGNVAKGDNRDTSVQAPISNKSVPQSTQTHPARITMTKKHPSKTAVLKQPPKSYTVQSNKSKPSIMQSTKPKAPTIQSTKPEPSASPSAKSEPSTSSSTKLKPIAQPSSAVDRAKENVKLATMDAKKFQAIADEAAKAATVAKRRAVDATNKLEEARRQLRMENEKEKALKNGFRYRPGWAWEESEEEEEDSRKRKRGEKKDEEMIGQSIDKEEASEGQDLDDGASDDDDDEMEDEDLDDSSDDDDDDDDDEMTDTESDEDSIEGGTIDLLG